jgi:hypothetical protein
MSNYNFENDMENDFESNFQNDFENDMENLYQDKRYYQDYRINDEFDEDGKMAELGVRGNRELQDPVQKFTSFVRLVARKMSFEKIINLTNQDIKFIMNQIDNIPNPEYKNPTGFVIGYWLVSSLKSYNAINRTRYNSIKANLKNIEYPLEEKDIIRYARFWILHNLLPELD